ncbi:hypothetical protein NIES4072_31460 [Nostoc commune NIES-4072]|uniref:DUF3102 domain-containing protein n=1 Tax=Nostoc commune NIES-4072 TaxID=2005467 RepID=A0A2R5FPR9_NOSCO|nr:DUF3102 domain-containing protein [Nostoc commune]BBD69521.1 hypothetical protein NIES4070_59300 [Nostoc commune HK-02]GBG19478.1 hypothetical protein NIES4072_31460 [Nostoc commune NIES-4072]
MNLLELANSINEVFKQSKQFYEAGIESFKLAIAADKEAGEMLIKVKSSLPYGQFGDWVSKNCDFTHRHANRLMLIAKNWEKIIATLDTRDESESLLPSLRTALALAAAEPKPEAPPPEPTPKYKVALKGHACYGETVEVKEELNKGDVLVCKTSKGEIPFLKKELIPESQLLESVDAEIIDVEVEDISEQLKEAIALVIEYLPEVELKAVLAASLSIGKEHLPSDAQSTAARLIGGQDLAILGQG